MSVSICKYAALHPAWGYCLACPREESGAIIEPKHTFFILEQDDDWIMDDAEEDQTKCSECGNTLTYVCGEDYHCPNCCTDPGEKPCLECFSYPEDCACKDGPVYQLQETTEAA